MIKREQADYRAEATRDLLDSECSGRATIEQMHRVYDIIGGGKRARKREILRSEFLELHRCSR